MRSVKNSKQYLMSVAIKLRLGDKVEGIAKPVAKRIDGVFKTKIQHCVGCQKRRDFLNNLTTESNGKSQNHNITDA